MCIRDRVTGAPPTSRIGTTIDNTMCWTMWALNSTYAYRAKPVIVMAPSTSRPPIHDSVRLTGQW